MPLPLEGVRACAPRKNKNTLARRPGVLRALGAALLTAALSGWAAAQTTAQITPPAQPLTLQAALDAAQARSYALVAQDAAARSARELAVAAERLPDPMLRLSVDNLPIDGPMRFSLTDDFMTMRSVGLTQTFTRADKRRARAARFEREADSAQAARAMQLAELRRGTALAWFDRYYQQQMVALLSKQRDEAALQIEAADAAYRAGRGAQADVFMARSGVARIEDRIREALAAAEVARQDKRVDWTASLMYSQRGEAFSNMVSVAVSVPLQWDQKNRQDRELAARLAKAKQARAEREEMTRAHLAETERWLATWRGNLARLADYDATLVPLAAERTRAALAAYRGGRGELAGVLEARRMEIDTRVERLRIENGNGRAVGGARVPDSRRKARR